MWIKKPFFEYATGTLLIVIILFFLGKIDYAFWPFKVIIATVFAPIVIAGLLYYILRPLLKLLTRYIPKLAGIALIFSLIAIILISITYFLGPLLKGQVTSLAELAPETIEEVTTDSGQAVSKFEFAGVSGTELKNYLTSYTEDLSDGLLENVMGILGMLMNVAVVLIVVPFILFFLLKDDEKLNPHLMKYLPEEHRLEGRKLLRDLDQTLSDYIVGQAIVAFTVGVLMYIGYIIIGLDYAFTLAVFAMFLIIVPFLGPLIGIIPAIFVALMSGEPLMAVKVLVVLLVVQQLEGNLVTPNIMGSRLNIHPLTIILLLLIAAALYGFVGILIAIPLYAVLKTVVHNFRLFIRLRKKRQISKEVAEKN
ncbi:pheromone autoinducer 2 transporter [Planococcus massiliensis]|uniref:Pheromone autoinducer 2 transporter n=1 Tax=Planococcus massiliensis TaxID=1499687 RepID=A0A098EPD5_9BACL|nr:MULTISPECIES: AI-2E family transporter [Planococcus]MCJ1909575.1 AI-2E family transporter [Planococcus ruber]CEG24139.1 pheromone autoinducer 2 transporter [Planococcus massiliensis]